MIPDAIWSNQDLSLYHGTDAESATDILENGIQLAYSKRRLDFGPGFYTTTSLEQARNWAFNRGTVRRKPPVVLSFDVDRDDLAALESLFFVRATRESTDFWQFVEFCRSGGARHARRDWYDLVSGLVTIAPLSERRVLFDSDQFSFHTERAIRLLNEKGNPRVV